MSKILDALNEIPLLDVHTHLDANHLAARGLHDILLYHMVIADLHSAGCPDGDRVPEDATEEEIEKRLERAVPYVKYIQNTSIFWIAKTILKDLYGWDQPITEDNWRELHARIKEKSQDQNWPREILKKANIRRACTELYLGRKGDFDDVLQYAVEWSLFARGQWGQYDTALVEMEYAWDQEGPWQGPLPVTMGESGKHSTKRIRTIEDVHTAIKHYCDKMPYDKSLGICNGFCTDIHFREVTDEEMEEALKNRENAGEKERDIYASYMLEYYLTELEKLDIPHPTLLFSIGEVPLPYETGSKIRPESVYDFARMAARHPKLRFIPFLASEHQNQAFCTVCRQVPNITMVGAWWHNFFPGIMQKIYTDRLDMIAANNQIVYFSDAYCVDWAYGKSLLVKQQFAKVLENKVESGQYTFEQAVDIATLMLWENPQRIFGMVPNEGGNLL